MNSNNPLIEQDLILMKIHKKGIRLRFLYKLEDELITKSGSQSKTKKKILPDLRC